MQLALGRVLSACVAMISFSGFVDAQSVKLAWDVSSAAAGYNVYRSKQRGVYSKSPQNRSTIRTNSSFTDLNVQKNQTYYYVVTAVNSAGLESSYSNEVQAVVSSSAAVEVTSSTQEQSADSSEALIGFDQNSVPDS